MIDIAGAGLAGLLAGNMLQHRDPQLHELQPELPNNHSAVLRFRTSAIGDVLNIPFNKVTMIKTHVPWKNPVADALAYSFKNSGVYRSDRSITAGQTTAERWIAPSDLIPQMARRLNINYNKPFTCNQFTLLNPVISTLPMPTLMKLLDYPRRKEIEFNGVPGWNIKANIKDCDAYISLLVPDPDIAFSRISITGNEIIIEAPNKHDGEGALFADLCLSVAAELLGLKSDQIYNISSRKQQYSKITPIDDAIRKAFMFWATDKFGIFSLGRFATWRPGLLLDDLIQDIRLIDRWITSGSYAIVRHR